MRIHEHRRHHLGVFGSRETPIRSLAESRPARCRILERADLQRPYVQACPNAERRFSAWCEGRGVAQFSDAQPVHVAAFLKGLRGEVAAPAVKQHLAALSMLFDWLVPGNILDVNPARHVVEKQDAGAT